MTRERQLLEEIEYSGANRIGLGCPLQENRLEVPQLLGDTQHLGRRQPASLDKHWQAIAVVWVRSKDIYVTVFQTHSRNPQSSLRSCCVNPRIACSSRR